MKKILSVLAFVAIAAMVNAQSFTLTHEGAAVAEGNGVLGIKAQMPSHIQDAFTLVGTKGGDVCEGRMPTA